MYQQHDATPKYLQVKKFLLNDILSGVYSSGTKLPSEEALCTKFQTSRITIRRAISELVKENYIRKQQGKGTIVMMTTPLKLTLLDINGFSDTVKGKWKIQESSSRILVKKIMHSPLEISESFGIPEGSDIIYLKRLFMLDNRPYMIDTAWFPCSIYPGLFDKLQDNVSTFQIIKNDYKLRFAKAYKEITASISTLEESHLFKCPVGSPLFCTKKIIFDPDERPIHLSKFLVRSDNVVYTLTYVAENETLPNNNP